MLNREPTTGNLNMTPTSSDAGMLTFLIMEEIGRRHLHLPVWRSEPMRQAVLETLQRYMEPDGREWLDGEREKL